MHISFLFSPSYILPHCDFLQFWISFAFSQQGLRCFESEFQNLWMLGYFQLALSTREKPFRSLNKKVYGVYKTPILSMALNSNFCFSSSMRNTNSSTQTQNFSAAAFSVVFQPLTLEHLGFSLGLRARALETVGFVCVVE